MPAPGVEKRRKLKEGGFNDEQIAAWQAETMRRLQEGGFSDEQIAAYFGGGTPDSAAVKALVDTEFAPNTEAETDDTPKVAQGFLQSLSAGYQRSIGGLAQRRESPEILVDTKGDFIETLGAGLGQAVGDLPVAIPSFVAGAKAGAPLGAAAGGAATRTPLGTGVGAFVGGGVGGGTTSGFITETTRQALINFYNDNENKGVEVDPRTFSSRLVAAVFDKSTRQAGGKGALVGSITGVAGGGGRALLPAFGGAVARETVITSGEVTVAATATAALEGRLPRSEDFAAALVIGATFSAGTTLATRSSPSLRQAETNAKNRYVRTGESPAEIAAKARKDPIVRQEIVAGDGAQEAGAVRRTVKTNADDGTPIADDVVINPSKVSKEGIEVARAAKTTDDAVIGAVRPDAVKRPLTTKSTAGAGDDAVANARAHIRSKIRMQETKGKSVSQIIDDTRYAFVNDLQHAVSAANSAYRAATGKRLKVEDNPGELMRLAYGAHARAELAVRQGVANKSGKIVVEGIEPILQRVGKDNYDGFREYAVARRVIEKEKQGLKSGFDFERADLVVKAGDKQFAKEFDNLQRFVNTQLDRLQESGILSNDKVDAIRQQNQDYVPFARLLDDTGASPTGVTARGLPVRNPVKEFTGSDKDILDPFEVIIKNRYAVEQIAANNIARKRLVDFNGSLPEEMRFMQRVDDKQMSVVKLAEGDTQLKKFLEDNGMGIEDVAGVHLYRAMSKRLGDGEFIVFENGVPVRYRTDDPNTAVSLMSLDRRSQNILSRDAEGSIRPAASRRYQQPRVCRETGGTGPDRRHTAEHFRGCAARGYCPRHYGACQKRPRFCQGGQRRGLQLCTDGPRPPYTVEGHGAGRA